MRRVWTSVDGISWSRIPRDPVAFAVDVRIFHVVAAGPGLVAFGGDEQGPASWTSVDGISWSRVSPGEGDFAASPGTSDVTAGGRAWSRSDRTGRTRRCGLAATEAGAITDEGGDGVDVGQPLPVAPGSMFRFDPETNQIAAVIDTAYEAPNVAAGEGTVWVRDYEGNDGRTVSQIDPETNRVVRTIGIVGEVRDMAIGRGSVWVTSSLEGEGVLVEIDARTGRFRRAVALGYSGEMQVAVGEGAVWVAAAERQRGASDRADDGRGCGDDPAFGSARADRCGRRRGLDR